MLSNSGFTHQKGLQIQVCPCQAPEVHSLIKFQLHCRLQNYVCWCSHLSSHPRSLILSVCGNCILGCWFVWASPWHGQLHSWLQSVTGVDLLQLIHHHVQGKDFLSRSNFFVVDSWLLMLQLNISNWQESVKTLIIKDWPGFSFSSKELSWLFIGFDLEFHSSSSITMIKWNSFYFYWYLFTKHRNFCKRQIHFVFFINLQTFLRFITSKTVLTTIT